MSNPAPFAAPSFKEKVMIDGIEAIVTKTYDPSDPHTNIDVLYYPNGKPRFLGTVEHGWNPGQWISMSEWEEGRPLTPLEAVQREIGRGNPHAPEVGREVVFGLNTANVGWVEVVPTRARIRQVVSLTEVLLAVYPPEPPSDPMEPDEPYYQFQNVVAHHAGTANPYMQKLGCHGHWCWPDQEELIRPFPLSLIMDVHPPHVCGRCRNRIKRFVPIYLGRDPRNTSIFVDISDIKICEPCNDELRDFLGLPPLPKRSPAVPPPEPVVEGEILSARAGDPLPDPSLSGPNPTPEDLALVEAENYELRSI